MHFLGSMQSAAAIQEHDSIRVAVRRAFEQATRELRSPLSVVFLFVSDSGSEIDGSQILKSLQELAPGIPVFGCSSESLIGGGRELERKTAASILAIGGLKEAPQIIALECIDTPDGSSVLGIDEDRLADAADCDGMLVLACPKTFSVHRLIESIEDTRGNTSREQNSRMPFVPILGGYAGHGEFDGSSTLFCGDHAMQRGAVGLILPKELRWNAVVSQGCRPIGDPMIVTKMEGDMIVGLGGRPALQQLNAMLSQLPNCERELAISSLLIGRAITENRSTFGYGDFLVRNVSGVDTEANGISVTDRFHVGQTIRFHVRDAATATSDLESVFHRAAMLPSKPVAGLMFSCNERGERMFQTPDHDSSRVQQYFPTTPIAGCFVAGEFASSAQQNFVHGFATETVFMHERDLENAAG